MKESPNTSPILLSQISAYMQNFFVVANLIEDSQTKAAALATIQEMEQKFLDVSILIDIHINIRYFYCSNKNDIRLLSSNP